MEGKIAVFLAKIADSADINNLRPIGLEDCMRKLWFSISYKRIAAAWDKYGALDEAHHGFVPNRGTESGFLDLLNQLEKRKNGGSPHYYAHGMLKGPSTASVARLYAWH